MGSIRWIMVVNSNVTGEQIYLKYYKNEPEIHKTDNNNVEINGDINEGKIEFSLNACLYHLSKYQ